MRPYNSYLCKLLAGMVMLAGWSAVFAGELTKLAPPSRAGEDGRPEAAAAQALPQSDISRTAAQTQYDHGAPSAAEQLFLALINRARANPQAEADRYGLDLNDGLDPGTISTAPKPPLAMSPALINSARLHSQWMLDNDVFSHTGEGGSETRDRIEAAGYPLGSSWQLAENIALRGTSGAVDQAAFVLQQHENLFRSPGHRENTLSPGLVEVGIGAVVGLYTDDDEEFNALMTTQNFARSSASPVVSPGCRFLLGIVYEDVDGNGFYTPGEGMAGVTVEPDSGEFFAVTSTSGGYAFPLPAVRGSFSVTLSGGGWDGPSVFEIATTGDNIQRDFVFDPDALPQPRSFVLDTPALTVPEGQTAELSFYLSGPPDTDLQATVARVSGDDDLAITGAATVTFTPADYGIRTVLVHAAEDQNTDNGTATFRISKTSGPNPVEDVDTSVTETDDDIVLSIQSNGPGTTNPSGNVLVDLDHMPFEVQAIPADDANFFQWSAGGASVTPVDGLLADVTAVNDASIVAFFLAFDADDDGMGDTWETTQFGNLSHDGSEDTDGDGITDLGEFLIQTDPHVKNIGITVIVLYPGWNAVSVPAQAAGLDVGDLFAAHVQGNVWQWHAQTQKYRVASGAAVETASYWVYVPDYTAIAF